jgi:hypothetical protein
MTRLLSRLPLHLHLALVALALVLSGCPDSDADEDGFAAEDDCDDSDPAINPDATEVCDDLDNDCDGTIDEADADDATTWYADVDGDGYGDAASSELSCDQPAGYALSSTDCDDLEALVNPGEAEVTCDGLDNDCDAATLDEPDGDGDGWVLCDDCDDADSAVYPGAGETTCNGIDDDCDPLSEDDPDADGDGSGFCTDCDDDEALVSPDLAEATCDGLDNDCDPATVDAPDADGDGYSFCYECNDADPAIHPDATEVTCDGIDNDCDTSTADGPDVDGDGYTVCDDCDDAEPAVNPGVAYDDCDTVDSDCNGTVDDGDGDSDGYTVCDDCDDAEAAVNPGVAYDDCDTVDSDCNGTVDDGDSDGDTYTACADCDESDPAINPGATEVCDGVNNDCDADVDEPDAADAPTWYEDYDGDLQGDATSFQVACNQPTGWVLSDEDCDDDEITIYLGADEDCDGGDENCNGLVDDGCTTVEHCGTISADETWSAMEVHHVTCHVYVEGGTSPELTIDDWTTVTFAAGVGLYIGTYGAGSLQAPGTGWITLTSADATPSAGDWNGLYFGGYDTGSLLSGATVEYGGGNGYGTVYAHSSDVEIIDSVVSNSSQHGLYVDGNSTPLVQGSSFLDNDLDGIYIGTSAGLEDGATPTFTGNTLTGNEGFAMSLPAEYVRELDASSTFVGNDDDFVRVHADTVVSDGTWQAIDVPFQVTGHVYIEGAGNPEVIVEDGATWTFNAGVGLFVGTYGSGALFVQGDVAGVEFTTADDTPSEGDWYGVYFGGYDTGSELVGAHVSYAGGNGYGGVYAHSADVEMTGCSSSWSSNHGMYVDGNSLPLIQGSTFESNDLDGIYIHTSAGLSRSGTPSFVGNTLTANGEFAMSLPADYVGELDSTSTFAGNDEDFIRVLADTVVDDATWQDQDVPLFVHGHVYIEGGGSPEVTIEDGATVTFNSGVGLFVGTYGAGALFVEGDATGVVFTAHDDTPSEGDWYGLYFGGYDDESDIVGLDVSYGGGNGYGNIYVHSSDATFDGCSSSWSSNHGVYVDGSSMPRFQNSTFSDNDLDGLYIHTSAGLDRDGSPGFVGNVLTGNGEFAMSLPAEYAGELDATSTFAGNDEDAVRMLADTVTDDATWQALDAPWFVAGHVYIEGGGSPNVTVQDGATLTFFDGVGLYVGTYGAGKLIVDGVTTGVVFTAADDTPNAGDWNGLYMGGYDDESELTGLDISYGGANGLGNVVFHNSDGSIVDSFVSDSSAWGVYRSGAAAPTVTNVVYSNNASGDLY